MKQGISREVRREQEWETAFAAFLPPKLQMGGKITLCGGRQNLL